MTTDEETAKARELSWRLGNRAAWRRMLGECLMHLTNEPKLDVLDGAAMVSELEDVRAALRRVCAEHGDNDWPDDLHLADVVEKHLGRHLDAEYIEPPLVCQIAGPSVVTRILTFSAEHYEEVDRELTVLLAPSQLQSVFNVAARRLAVLVRNAARGQR